MTPIQTTQEELTAVVTQVMEKVLDRHLRIMYANVRLANSTLRASDIGFLVGMNEISDFLHCSIPTARKRLETVLKPAVLSEKGQRCLLDGDLALKILQKNAERHRQALRHPKNKNHD